MEILVELLIQALALLVQFILEMLVQVFAEALFELGIRGVADIFKRPPVAAALAAAGYLALGAAAGGISLWFFPNLFIEPGWARWLNLLVTPSAAGAVMAGVGSLREKRGQTVMRLDTYGYGFLFALSMAGVRFIWGK